jgi:two-component system phosphate regulon sensor histidine kinase PhoR
MFISIRWRIAIPTILIITLSMAGLGIALSNLVRHSKLEDIQLGLETTVRLLAAELTHQASLENQTEMDTLADDWAEVAGMRITLIAASGEVVGESHRDHSQMENHADRPEFLEALATGLGSSVRFSETLGYEMLYTAAPYQSEGEVGGVVRAAFPLDSLDADLRQLQRAVWLATGISAAVMALVTLWLANRTAKPLAALIDSTRKIEAGDLSARIFPRSRDEVGQLGLAFDGMAEQLQTRFAALREEKAKLSSILSEMTDGVILVDAEGAVTMINSAARTLFGMDDSVPLGASLIRFLGQHQLVDIWKESAQSNDIQVIEMQVPGQGLQLHVTAIPVGTELDGNTLIMLRDLTELRRLETVRRDFLSNISHELRTPLASLTALSETLEMGAMEDPEAAERFISLMQKELEALAHLVSELLELSRIESGQVPLKLIAVDPCALISQVGERMSLQVQQAGLTMHVECPQELPSVLADPPRLEQVILNLVHNAIKFTPQGGKVTVQAAADQDEVTFIVRDTGVGIPKADLPRIFERFYKTPQGRQREGTGLGLAIAKHLVEAHGGRIWAESIQGQGSSFYFSIPSA